MTKLIVRECRGPAMLVSDVLVIVEINNLLAETPAQQGLCLTDSQ